MQVGALHVERRLDDVVVCDLRIPLAVEYDLDESRLVNSAFELSELGLDVLPHRVRCLTVPHRELKSHRHSFSEGTVPI